jgi:hypothetical protein
MELGFQGKTALVLGTAASGQRNPASLTIS